VRLEAALVLNAPYISVIEVLSELNIEIIFNNAPTGAFPILGSVPND